MNTIQMDSNDTMINKESIFNWNNFNDRKKMLTELKDGNELMDVMLITDDGCEKMVHSSIISSLGMRFNHVLNESFDSSQSHVTLDNGTIIKKVMVKGINSNVLNAFIEFTYRGNFKSIDRDNLISILKTADMFQIKEIVNLCCTHLTFRIDESNCVDSYKIGINYGHSLGQSAWNYIKTHFSNISVKTKQLESLTLCELTKYIDSDHLNIKDEKIIWSVIKKWCEFDYDSRGKHLKDLLLYLRFHRIEQNFHDHILRDSLIKNDDSATAVIKKHIKEYRQKLYGSDGNDLPIGLNPKSIRPRVPHEVIFAIGGWQKGVTSTLIETYDVRTDLWFCSQLSHDYPRAYHGTEVFEGIIYLIGGTNGINILNTVNCFNPITNKWYERSNMCEHRCYVSTAQIDGIIYALGGFNGKNRKRSCEKYDPIANQWTQIENMIIPRSDASAAVADGKIYIAGGLNDHALENTVEVYNPKDHTWTLISPMNSIRSSHKLINYHESIYAIGGNSGNERTKSVERYDIAEHNWIEMPNMISNRSTFDVSILEDELYVIGGYNGYAQISTVEKFNDTTNEWTKVKSLRHHRSGLSTCVISGLSNAIDYTFIGFMENNEKDNKTKEKFSFMNRFVKRRNESTE